MDLACVEAWDSSRSDRLGYLLCHLFNSQVCGSKCHLVDQGRASSQKLVFGDVVPDRKDHLLSSAHLSADQAVEFVLRPPLVEEV